MSMNCRNFGIVTGRLTRDVIIKENDGGSKTVLINVAAKNNYKNADGGYDPQYCDLKAFIPASANGLGVYGYMKKGTMVTLHYSLRQEHFVDKEGKERYEQVCRVETVDLLSRAPKAAADETAEAPAEAVEDVVEEADATPFE